MSPNLGQSLERAHRCARDQSHRLVTLEHLLLALTEDAEAALILQSANVDLARLGTDVSGYLGRLLEDMRAEPGAEPRPDAELLRVLQAAASAAQQSRRKQIDGAIVLAAIVGDGKSPAAGLLKALGMTFEEAIRALQRANTKARLKPLAKAAAAAAVQPSEAPTMPAPADAGPQPGAPEPPLGSTSPSPSRGRPSLSPWLRSPPTRSWRQRGHASRSAHPLRPRRIPQSCMTRRRTHPRSRRPSLSGDGHRPAARNRRPGPGQVPDRGDRGGHGISHSRGAEPLLPPTGHTAAADRTEQAQPAPVAPPAPAAARPARATWTPPPEPRPQPALARLPQPTPARAPPPPFPARPLQPNEGPRRPPLPPRATPYGQPPAGLSQSAGARALAGTERARRRRAAPARQWQLCRISSAASSGPRAARPWRETCASTARRRAG